MLAFGYAAAHDLKEAIAELARAPDAMPIAGGTDMVQLLREAVIAPRELIDIGLLPLTGIQAHANGLRIGALAKLSDVVANPHIRSEYPVLARALEETASPQVRNAATVGGNLLQRTRCLYFRDASAPCNKRESGSGCPAQNGQNRMNAILGGSPYCIAAYPGDMANALIVLDAAIEIEGPQGSRRISVEELHREPGDTPHRETNLRQGEIITAILLPTTSHARNSHYVKVRDRASFEWALVSAAVAIEVADRAVRMARVAAGGVGTRPWRLPQVEACLMGKALDRAAARAASETAADGAEPRQGNGFKVVLMQHAVERALLMAGGLA